MQLSLYRSTTSLVMIFGLAGNPLYAQGVDAKGIGATLGLDAELTAVLGAEDLPRKKGVVQLCALADPVPCVLPSGKIATKGEADAAAAAAENPEAQEMAKLFLAADAEVAAGAKAAAGDAKAAEEAAAAEAKAAEQAAAAAAKAAEDAVAAETKAAEKAAKDAEKDAKAAADAAAAEAKAAEDAAAADAKAVADAATAEAKAAEDAVAAQAKTAEKEAKDAEKAAAADAKAAEKAADDAAKAAEKEAKDAEKAAAADAKAAEKAADDAAKAAAEAKATEDKAAGDKAAEDAAAAAAVEAELKAAEQAEAKADADAAADAEAKAAADAQAIAEAEALEAAKAAETVEARDDAGLTEEQAAAEAAAQDAAQEVVSEAAAAALEAGAEGVIAEGSGEVVTETIAADDVRASDEDFVKPDAEAKAEAAKKRSGLSDFEKIAILGIGALVVGAILKNGDRVVASTDDRAVVQRDDGSVYILKNDDQNLRQPGSTVETRRFDDGSTLSVVTREDGTEVRTIRDANGRVLRRTRVLLDGSSVVLFDDTAEVAPVDVATLPKARANEVELSDADLDAALRRELRGDVGRRFSLGQVRNIRAVRELVPIINLDSITFDTGSAAIRAEEAEELVGLGRAMQAVLADNPGEVFLIEGHTDAVGSATSNLTLSDRRAESLALALTEYFDIPPENLVVQGYGESYLKVPVLTDERANRRVAVRRITPLLTASN